MEAEGTTEWKIWINFPKLDSQKLQLASSADVADLFVAIRERFKFLNLQVPLHKLVLQTKDTDDNPLRLNDAKLTLAEALCNAKRDSKGDYDVDVGEKETWLQALDSPLPRAQIKTGLEVSTTKTTPVGRCSVQQLTRWVSFADEAINLRLPESPNWVEDMQQPGDFVREAQVWAAIAANVGRFFNGTNIGRVEYTPRSGQLVREPKRKLSEQETKQEPPSKRVPTRSPFARGDPDLVGLDLNSFVVGVIEAKTPWAIQLDDAELVAKYNERRSPKLASTFSAIAQTIGYMMDNDTRYGALTTYNTTRFFRAVSFDRVEISDAIQADASTSKQNATVTLRRAFAYWLSLCCGPTSLLAYYIPRKLTKDYMNDHKKILSDGKLTSLDGHGLFVSWDDIQISAQGLGGGAHGTVALANWNQQLIALKLVDVKNNAANEAAFQQELSASVGLRRRFANSS